MGKSKGGVPVFKKSKKVREEIKVPPRNVKLDITVSSRDLPLKVRGNVSEPVLMRLIDAVKRGIISDEAYREAMCVEDVLAEDRVTIIPNGNLGDLVSGFTVTEDKRKVYK